jgi:DNA-binding transcriptional MerR regulator
MIEKELYSIGEVSKICNISKKTLRFYDDIGLVSPDQVSDENHYRFYTRKSLLTVPIIKYYKQMGFKLEEMRELLDGNNYEVFEKHFRLKIDALRELEKQVYESYHSVKDWYELILEAESVIENNATEVGVKYLESADYCYMEQDFEFNYMESIINIDFTNYLDSIDSAITGPVIIMFPSFRDRIAQTSKRIRILQKPIRVKDKNMDMVRFGGYMVASCYHIGPHENMGETYKKIMDYAKTHGYQCDEESYERYVTDYWTTRNVDQFVTEILIRVTKS